MKNLLSTLLFAFLAFSISACASKKADILVAQSTHTLRLTGFNAISNSGHALVHFTQGNAFKVTVKESPQLTSTIKVENRTLVIRTKQIHKNHGSSIPVELWVTAPTLSRIANSGALKLYSSNLNVGSMEMTNSGAVTYHMGALRCTSLDYRNSGASNITADIYAPKVNIKNSGSDKNFLTISGADVTLKNSGATQLTIRIGQGRGIDVMNDGSMKGSMNITAEQVKYGNDGSMNLTIDAKASTMEMKNRGAGKDMVTFRGESIKVTNDGADNVTLNVDCKHLDTYNAGTSKMVIRGTADDTKVKSSGIAKTDTSGLNKF